MWPLTRRLASSLTACGCWPPCVGHGVAHGLHELRDVRGRVRVVDLSAAQWLYASVFRGEESLSQMARMA